MSTESLRVKYKCSLFLQLSELGLHLVQVRVSLAFRVSEWLLNHQELVKFMSNIKVCPFRLYL